MLQHPPPPPPCNIEPLTSRCILGAMHLGSQREKVVKVTSQSSLPLCVFYFPCFWVISLFVHQNRREDCAHLQFHQVICLRRRLCTSPCEGGQGERLAGRGDSLSSLSQRPIGKGKKKNVPTLPDAAWLGACLVPLGGRVRKEKDQRAEERNGHKVTHADRRTIWAGIVQYSVVPVGMYCTVQPGSLLLILQDSLVTFGPYLGKKQSK